MYLEVTRTHVPRGRLYTGSLLRIRIRKILASWIRMQGAKYRPKMGKITIYNPSG